MYGDTPPAVIAINPCLLQDHGGFEAVAWALERFLRRAPAWIVVAASPRFEGIAEHAVRDAMQELADDPVWRPPDRDPTVTVLRRHLGDLGVPVAPVRLSQADRVPRPSAAIVAAGTDGTDTDALPAGLEVATALGASRVVWWKRGGRDVAAEEAASVAGLDLVVEDPRVEVARLRSY